MHAATWYGVGQMQECELTVDSGGARLSGTLCVPDSGGPFATVLMLAGSGPVDRDENMSGQRLDVFNTIAHDLAARGVASVRYDKRGVGKSTGDFLSAGHSDHLADAMAWLDVLARDGSVDGSRLFAMGHSEGSLVAPQLALSRPLRGLVLLAPCIEPMESVLMRQAAQVEREITGFTRFLVRLRAGSPTAAQRALIDAARSTTEDSVRVYWQRQSAKWLRELLALDMREVFPRVECPMLLVGGTKDMQCDPADVARIAAIARAPTEQIVFDDLTHILRRDDRPASMLGISKLVKRPLDAEVLTRVGTWIEDHARVMAQAPA